MVFNLLLRTLAVAACLMLTFPAWGATDAPASASDGEPASPSG